MPPSPERPPDSPLHASDAGRLIIGNAGVVLLTPYLPLLFKRAEVVDPERFRDEGCAWQAVHMIENFTNPHDAGDQPTSPLSRVLCGLSETEDRAAKVSAEHRALCTEALQAAIRHWPDLQNMSVTALRETFLQRTGRLERREGVWRLTVERRSVDVLVDRVPWSFSVIKYPWMTAAVHVQW